MTAVKARVAIVRCANYEARRVARAVKEAVDRVGGMRQFVKSGQTVLVKPNLLSAKFPEEIVHTHPEVVRAVVRLAKDADELICLRAPSFFIAVGQFYREFDPVEDEEVLKILKQERLRKGKR